MDNKTSGPYIEPGCFSVCHSIKATDLEFLFSHSSPVLWTRGMNSNAILYSYQLRVVDVIVLNDSFSSK